MNYPYVISGVILSSNFQLAVISNIEPAPDICYPEWDYYYQYPYECEDQDEHKPSYFLKTGDRWHGYTVGKISYRTVILTINGCDHVINVGEPFWDQD